MRRILVGTALVALAGLFAVESAAAQVMHPEAPRLGAKLGAVWADLDEDIDDVETSTTTGFMGGVYAVIHAGQRFAVQPELLYVEKGAEVGTGDRELGEIDLTYVELPVLLRLDLTRPATGLVAYALAGPYVGFLIDCALTIEGVDEEFECGDDDADTPNFNDVDYGLAFGGGLGWDIGRGRLLVEGRYSLGLAEVEDDPDQSFVDIDLNNRVFGLMAGVSIPLGAKIY